jgi:hypothetical protein
MYRLQFNPMSQQNDILDLENNLVIPSNENNHFYQKYLEWVAEGNTAEPEPELVYTALMNKAKAKTILMDTDWTQAADVTISNKQEFVAYRAKIRAIALNPTDGNLDWGTEPTPSW